MSEHLPVSATPSRPPEAWAPLLRLARIATRPLERFLRIEAASGILLLLSAAAALVWANSSWADSYRALWHTPLGLRVGNFHFERSLEWLVNDGLMVIFFFVVGLEIRREIHQGELSEWRRAALPAAAALGGMLAPAGLYLLFAGQPATRSGWGIPMATDIAFAVGVLTLLGKRVPPALRVLLLALAVIDDLGAIVVIALFYSQGLEWLGFAVAALGFLGIYAQQRLGVRVKLAYVPASVVAWAGVYAAGVHPTIAGVLVGLMTPVRAWYGAEGFRELVQAELGHLTAQAEAHVKGAGHDGHPDAHELGSVLHRVEIARREARSPAEALMEALHPWVAFGIMPLFALANSGVSLSSVTLEGASLKVALGVAVGLVVGKPLGVLAACWLTLALGVSALPKGLSLRHLVVLGVVAGIGFTMSIFIAQLAFVGDAAVGLLGAAKLGVLGASGAAAVLGLVVGASALPVPEKPHGARSADEAETSTVL